MPECLVSSCRREAHPASEGGFCSHHRATAMEIGHLRDSVRKQAREIDTLRRTVDAYEDRITELQKALATWETWEREINELLRE